MKKLIVITMIATMIFSITSCGTTNSTQSSSDNQKTGAIEATVEDTTEIATEPPTTVPSAVGPGNYIENGNLKISFEMAKQYDEIQENEYYTAKPEEGKKYLVLFFEVENISSEEQNINMFYHKAYLDNYEIKQSTLLVNPEGYDMLSGDLAAGKKLKGYVCYEVDSDWNKLEFTYTDGITSNSTTYDFVVTSDELN